MYQSRFVVGQDPQPSQEEKPAVIWPWFVGLAIIALGVAWSLSTPKTQQTRGKSRSRLHVDFPEDRGSTRRFR